MAHGIHSGGDDYLKPYLRRTTLIKEIVVVADSKQLITPCGACLQRIFEFSDKNTKVHLADLTSIKKTYLISDLLPLAFNEKELKK